MTENEKKYAEAYAKKQEECGGKLTLLDWDEMTALRKELCLTVGQCNRISKVVESIGLIETHPMRQRGDIVLSNIRREENDPYAALLDEIDKYSAYADELVKDTISLQQKTDAIIQQVGEYASIVGDLAVNNYKKGNKREAKVLGGAVAIAGIATWLYSKYKEAELNERQEKQMAELLAKKQDLAILKLSAVQQQCTKFRESVLAKSTKIFLPELQKDVNIKEKIDIKLKMFKHMFLMMVKSMYLVNTLEYIEGEMQAWLNGQQSSEALRPLVAETVDNVIYSWFDENKISRMDISAILNGAENAKLASLFLLSEPYLLRRHIGVKLTNNTGFEYDSLFASDHYDEPIILSAYSSISYLYNDNNASKIVNNKWTEYVTKCGYVEKCDDTIATAFADVPTEGVVPRNKKVKFWIFYPIICIIFFCFNFWYGIIGALGIYAAYHEDCEKIAKKLFPIQRQEFIVDAAKKVVTELDNYETNKI